MTTPYKGIKIFNTTQGEGKAIVLLHGFLESSTMWEQLAPVFAKTHQVITIDLLGHGQTDCLGYVHTMEMMAEAVEAVLQKLGITSASFVGHSMGGYVSLAYAEKFPKKVEKLILLNSTPFEDSAERKKNRDRAIEAVKFNSRNFISMSIANLFIPANRKKFSKEIDALKAEALKMPIQGIVAALEGMKIRKDRSFLLTNQNFNSFIFLGTQDPVISFKEVTGKIQSTDCKTITLNDGHMGHLENFEDVKKHLQHILEQ